MARKRINPTLSEGLDGDVWQEFLANVRGHLRNDGDWNSLVEETGLARATIENLAWGTTVSPHMRTVYRIMVALGRKKEFDLAVRSANPMGLKEAQRHVRNKRRRIDRRRKKAAAKKQRGKKSTRKKRSTRRR